MFFCSPCCEVVLLATITLDHAQKLLFQQPAREELYSLTSQFRRAAVSTPANIAEGFKKRTKSDKARFMNISQGSLEECRYYLILSEDLGYGDNRPLMWQLEEVSKLLESYTTSIRVSSY